MEGVVAIEVTVSEAYPCWVRFKEGGNMLLQLRHCDLLEWEHAIQLAKQKCLMKLPVGQAYEVDPAYTK